jgi:hypothetical protein
MFNTTSPNSSFQTEAKHSVEFTVIVAQNNIGPITLKYLILDFLIF